MTGKKFSLPAWMYCKQARVSCQKCVYFFLSNTGVYCKLNSSANPQYLAVNFYDLNLKKFFSRFNNTCPLNGSERNYKNILCNRLSIKLFWQSANFSFFISCWWSADETLNQVRKEKRLNPNFYIGNITREPLWR